MSESGADEKATRSWSSGKRRSDSGSRYLPSSFAAPEPNRDDEAHSVAGIQQAWHEPDIIFVVKRDSTVLHVSHPGYGAPQEGEAGRSILGFFAQEFAAEITRAFEHVFAYGESQSFVCCGNPPLAVGSWYRCRVSPNHAESGVESATVFVRDITEWKHSEDEFRSEIDVLRSQIAKLSTEKNELTDMLATQEQRDEELSRFREIMNHAGEAIFITDPHTGRFVDVNETACRWLGSDRERLLQMGVGDLDLEFPLESRGGVSEHVTDTRDANRPKELVLGAHRRRNGTSFPVEVTISPRRFGDHDFLLVVARDVKQRSRTERAFQHAENERRGLSELSRDAVYCTARDGTVCEVNDSALDLFGYTRDEFLGLEARRLFLHPEHINAFKRSVEENGSVKNVSTEFKTKSGRWFEGLLGATLRYDADGNVQGYQCIIAPADEAAPEEPSRAIPSTALEELEREAERAKRETEEARAEAASAGADAEQARSQAAQARSDAEKAHARAFALESEAERLKSEIQEARSEAAKAREDMEQSLTQAAIAKLEAKRAQERADALQRGAARTKQELKQARSEAVNAKVGVEQALARAANARLDAEDAQRRAERLEREAEGARSEADEVRADAEAARWKLERAQLELTRAKAEAEQALSEAAKAKAESEQARAETAAAHLDAEQAKERVRELELAAESAAADTQRAVQEAAQAWADMEEGEREIVVTRSSGGGTRLLVAPEGLHQGGRQPELWPKRRNWPGIFAALAVIAVTATAVGYVALQGEDDRTGNWTAIPSDSTASGEGEALSPDDSMTVGAPGSDAAIGSPVEPAADTVAG